MKKRILAALLSAVMVFTMIPFMGVTAYAENTKGPGDEYVSLPITIRDYAADGMLFDWNDMGQTGTITGKVTYPSRGTNPAKWLDDNYTYARVTTYGYNSWAAAALYWHCIICNSDGSVKKVIPSETSKGDANSGTYKDNMTSGC